MAKEIRRIWCPSDAHKDHKKILAGYEENGNQPPRRIYIHCGVKDCGWVRITFVNGGVTCQVMKGKPRFPLHTTPTLVYSKDYGDKQQTPGCP
jgi:hypothetical protein